MPGQFEGSVTLASDEKPEGDKINMNVWVTSLWRQAAGVCVILAGVCVNLLVTVFVRNRISRNQLLRPAAVLNSSLDRLIEVTKQVNLPSNVDKSPVFNKISDQRKALDYTVLEDQGLPPAAVSPWPASADTVDNYRRHVQTVSNWVGVLEVVVLDGLVGVGDRWSRASNAGKAKELNDALDQILVLIAFSVAPPLDAVRKSVSEALDKLDKLLLTNEALLEGDHEQRIRPTRKSAEELRVETAILSHVGWLFLIVATTLAGAYVLVFSTSAAGFGTPLDYLLCLAWGIGLPAAGQLTQATTSTVASNFGIVKV